MLDLLGGVKLYPIYFESETVDVLAELCKVSDTSTF